MFVATNRIKIKKGFGEQLEELFRSRGGGESQRSRVSWTSSCGAKTTPTITRNIWW